MSRRANAMLVAMLLASPLVAAPSVWASGPSGGSSPTSAPRLASINPGSGGASLGGDSPGTGLLGAIGSLVTTATGDGITVSTNVSALLGGALAFTGATTPTRAGETIVVQRLDRRAGWVGVATGTIATSGAFSVPWHTNYAGRVTMRTVLERGARASGTGPTSPTLEITVYRPGLATYYGQGFFGQKTACGKILKRTTLGVANRTLRCGTEVQIYYGGRTIIVPVIDRGPFANHASWDLTQATAQALGMLGTETVGVMPV